MTIVLTLGAPATPSITAATSCLAPSARGRELRPLTGQAVADGRPAGGGGDDEGPVLEAGGAERGGGTSHLEQEAGALLEGAVVLGRGQRAHDAERGLGGLECAGEQGDRLGRALAQDPALLVLDPIPGKSSSRHSRRRQGDEDHQPPGRGPLAPAPGPDRVPAVRGNGDVGSTRLVPGVLVHTGTIGRHGGLGVEAVAGNPGANASLCWPGHGRRRTANSQGRGPAAASGG